MPADNVGRNLVADAVGQNRRMISATFGGLTDHGSGSRLFPLTFEKAEMLGPGHVHENRKALLLGLVQKPRGRQMISAEGVDGRVLHSPKIIRHGVGRRKWLAPAG